MSLTYYLQPENILRVLDDLTRYFKQRKKEGKVGEFLNEIKEDIKVNQQTDIKEKFIKLISETDENNVNDIVITKNNKGLYDVWLMSNANKVRFYLTTDEIIDALAEHKITGYVVEDVSLEDCKSFIKACYLYYILCRKAGIDSNRKDLVYNEIRTKNWQVFDNMEFNLEKWERSTNYVVFPPEICTLNSLTALDLSDYIHYSFSSALELIYTNKLAGTKIKMLK